MFQLRMSFKRPDGSQIEYDDENLHGDVESMSQQILANSFCNYPDAALSVEVYTLDQPYNRLNRLPAPAGSFWIYAGDNGVFKRYGYGTVWPSLTIRFSWSCR